MKLRSRRAIVLGAVIVVACLVLAAVRPGEPGYGRLYAEQTYHHQALRALNHVAAGGADVSEVLEVTTHVRAGDAQGWYAAWTALGDRNLARANATRDVDSRGEALLRVHSYDLRAEFFLPSDDPKRLESLRRNKKAFYEGLATLGVGHERLAVPYEGKHLNALYFAPSSHEPARKPLIVFCGISNPGFAVTAGASRSANSYS